MGRFSSARWRKKKKEVVLEVSKLPITGRGDPELEEEMGGQELWQLAYLSLPLPGKLITAIPTGHCAAKRASREK